MLQFWIVRWTKLFWIINSMDSLRALFCMTMWSSLTAFRCWRAKWLGWSAWVSTPKWWWTSWSAPWKLQTSSFQSTIIISWDLSTATKKENILRLSPTSQMIIWVSSIFPHSRPFSLLMNILWGQNYSFLSKINPFTFSDLVWIRLIIQFQWQRSMARSEILLSIL